MDLLISHITEVTSTGDLSIVEDIHFSYDELIETI
jgi:hypothetical protein